MMTAPSASRVFATVLFCCLPALAQSKPEPEWYSRASCPSLDPPLDNPLPASLSKETVLRDLLDGPLARTEVKLDKVCAVLGERWKSQKEPSFLVVLETALFEAEDGRIKRINHQLRVGLYRQDSGGVPRLVAKTSPPVSLEVEATLMFLDLAPYKLTPTEYAFGVRTSQWFTWPAGGGKNEYLEVFRVQGKAIRSILSPTLMKSWRDRLGDNPAEFGDKDGAQISVLKTRTSGIFNWRFKKGRASDVLKWAGGQYESAAPLVEDVNPHY